MGLSAPTLPIDLANGAQFANTDGDDDPRTNLLYCVRVITGSPWSAREYLVEAQ